MREKHLLFVAWLAIYPTQALAGHAYTFMTVTMGTVFGFLDTGTMQIAPDGKVTASSLFVETNPADQIAGKLVRYHLFQSEYDCAARTVRQVQGVSYDASGNMLFASDTPETHQIIAGTETATLFQAACGQGKAQGFDDIAAAISFADSSAVKRSAPKSLGLPTPPRNSN